MSARLAFAVISLMLAGCDMSSLPHGNLGMPDMSGGPGFSNGGAFNNKNYADPSPHSASDDAQRAAYQQHQQDQMNAAGMNSGPDLSHMSCSGSSVSSSGTNAGTFSSSSSCHN
jgi:hypothetical protein